MDDKKIKIALFAGGTSPERAVSKSTGAAIYKALKSLGYPTVVIDPAYGKNQPADVEQIFCEKDYAEISNRNYVEAVNSSALDDIDLVFLALHGKWGEDGTVQSLLDLRGVKYTGSNVLSSSLAMDKMMSKILFQHYGIATPRWFAIDKNGVDYKSIAKIIDNSFGYPCVIKPNDQGSTVGLTICKNEDDVESAVKLAHEFANKALIEEYIDGHEMTVALLENKALPVLEIKPKHTLYDYECKYTNGMSEYVVPANIPQEASERLQEQALKAFHALGCTGYGRADFRMDTSFNTFCLEINTLPGMTSTSLVPKMAKAVGISFEELVEKIIKLSL
ncbi:MAG: D-alanine--D-alanine ligase [Ignavibacteriaceae bacterium]|nr:D-alanine--D-alanine ligase [Ignavibacteriaceae bacterium]